MVIRRRHEVEDEDSSHLVEVRRGLGAKIGGVVLTVALVTGILYLAMLLIARTDGFRSVVTERISDWSGMPVEIEKARLTAGLDLKISGLQAIAPDTGVQVKLSSARVDWSPAAFFALGKSAVRTIDLQGGSIVFRPGRRGAWQPAWLHAPFSTMFEGTGRSIQRLNPPPEAVPREEIPPDSNAPVAPSPRQGSPTETSPDAFWEDVALRIQDGHLTWQDRDERVVASVQGLNLTVTPLRAPLRTFHHFQAWMDEMKAGPERMEGVSLEFLSYGDEQVIVAFTAEWTGPGTTLRTGAGRR